MKLNQTEIQKWEDHCRSEYPNEACAIIVDGQVIPTPNSAENPAAAFRIDPQHYGQAMIEGRLQAVLHSHIITQKTSPKHDPRTPSEADLVSWIAMAIPFGISAVNTDQVSDPLWLDDNTGRPLEGREFVWGYSDCFTLVRDYYKQTLNIKLKNYPRGSGWDSEHNHIVNRYKDCGFVEVDKDNLQVHDLLVFQVRAPYPNHLAVVTDTNEMLHQFADRLSGKETIAKWGNHVVLVLRYKGKEE